MPARVRDRRRARPFASRAPLAAPLAVPLAAAAAILASGPLPTTRARADEVWPAIDLARQEPLTTALAPGDRLEVEAAISFGFRADRLDEPLAIQARARLDVRERAPGLIVVGARIEIVSVRYRGPSLAFSLDRPECGPSLDTVASVRGGRALAPVPTADPVLDDLVERQRRVAAAAALLHGVEVGAVVTPGREPWVSLLGPVPDAALREEREDEGAADAHGGATPAPAAPPAAPHRGGIAPADDLVRDRLLRGLLLIAFPPVPLDLRRDDPGYTAGQARHAVLASVPSLHPLPGEELRVRALEPTTFARAFYAFEAVNELGGGVRPAALRLRADERARVHPRLGVASFREVDTHTAIELPDGRVIEARARWRAMLTAADVAAVRAEGARRGAGAARGSGGTP